MIKELQAKVAALTVERDDLAALLNAEKSANEALGTQLAEKAGELATASAALDAARSTIAAAKTGIAGIMA